jgi:small subunit ribosomal protein S11
MAKQIEKQLKNEDSETTKRCSSHSINFNNTIVTITNLKEKLFWSSAGAAGLKELVNRRLAAKTAAETAARQSMDQGLKQAKVMVSGPGRETAIRGLIDSGLQITLIRDITTIPHNGCRPPKTSCLRYY